LGAGKARSQPVLADRPGKNACLHRAAGTGEKAAESPASSARFVRRFCLQILLLALTVLSHLVGMSKKKYLSPSQPFSLALLQLWNVLGN
jgi:hypothetical protein